MLIKFTKMHGIGNDFVVIDAINQSIQLSVEQVRHLCDRRFGVGCDQLLLVEESRRKDVDFKYRIFNADGSEVEQCGNGARCFVQFVLDKHLSTKTDIQVETQSGIISLHLLSNGHIRVNMGAPEFDPASLPFLTDHQSDRYQIKIDQQLVEFGAVSIGNPHAVILVEDLDSAPVQTLGSKLESHEQFPSRVNVGFMQIIDRNRIQLRVYERGVGETLACGTGACAAVVMGIRWGLLNNKVTVELRGGNLSIEWQEKDSKNSAVTMTGPAVQVFEGQVEL